jgi:nitrogen fixation NifU-like protein
VASDLRELYQSVILDHNQRPRNYGSLTAPTHAAEGYNPLCGDRVNLTLDVEGDVIREARFEGAGCAISTASASVMTEVLTGRTLEEAEALFDSMLALVTGDPTETAEPPAELGKLAVFSGVREYPVRVKCATLPWHTLRAALDNRQAPVSTE